MRQTPRPPLLLRGTRCKYYDTETLVSGGEESSISYTQCTLDRDYGRTLTGPVVSSVGPTLSYRVGSSGPKYTRGSNSDPDSAVVPVTVPFLLFHHVPDVRRSPKIGFSTTPETS